MAKVHLVEDARVWAVKPELESNVTPMVSLDSAIVELVAHATDECPLQFQQGKLLLALRPELAEALAQGLLEAVKELGN